MFISNLYTQNMLHNVLPLTKDWYCRSYFYAFSFLVYIFWKQFYEVKNSFKTNSPLYFFSFSFHWLTVCIYVSLQQWKMLRLLMLTTSKANSLLHHYFHSELRQMFAPKWLVAVAILSMGKPLFACFTPTLMIFVCL